MLKKNKSIIAVLLFSIMFLSSCAGTYTEVVKVWMGVQVYEDDKFNTPKNNIPCSLRKINDDSVYAKGCTNSLGICDFGLLKGKCTYANKEKFVEYSDVDEVFQRIQNKQSTGYYIKVNDKNFQESDNMYKSVDIEMNYISTPYTNGRFAVILETVKD